jgi:hypothetical protein
MAPLTASPSAGLRVDDAIENAVLTIVGPGAIAAATAAEKEVGQRRDHVREALGRDRVAARYAVDPRLPAIRCCRSSQSASTAAQ